MLTSKSCGKLLISKGKNQGLNFFPMNKELKFSDLTIGKKLGCGNYGTVYKAEFKKQTFAVKVIYKIKKMDINPEQEARIQQKLDSPFIIKCLNILEDDAKWGLILEWVNGINLYEWIEKNGPLKEQSAKPFIKNIAMAIKHCHDNNILHNDIKLDNCIFDAENNVVKITDFGFSKILGKNSTVVKTSNTLSGTLDYLSPEQVKWQQYGYPVDIWAFGITIYELLVGKCPFLSSDSEKTLNDIMNELPIYPKSLSVNMVNLLNRMLHKDPNKRPTIDEIIGLIQTTL